jgi:hypothetical protein
VKLPTGAELGNNLKKYEITQPARQRYGKQGSYSQTQTYCVYILNIQTRFVV